MSLNANQIKFGRALANIDRPQEIIVKRLSPTFCESNMADEQNKSKAPPMNGGFGLSEIEKIGQSAYTVPKSEQKERDHWN